jgi:hypothetical protein
VSLSPLTTLSTFVGETYYDYVVSRVVGRPSTKICVCECARDYTIHFAKNELATTWKLGLDQTRVPRVAKQCTIITQLCMLHAG